MKTLLLVIFAWSLTASAQSEGSFEIKQDDFKYLFNKARTGQPDIVPWAGTFWPYVYHGTAAKTDGYDYTGSNDGTAPLEVFGKISGRRRQALDWEYENHGCDKITDPKEREGCEGWFGHCNGWTAAAIKEPEPRKSFKVKGNTLDVATAKGILSEAWLTTSSLFEGDSDKSSTVKDGLGSGWIADPSSPTYAKFWDVSPRTFFLIATNYMGLKKMGFAIDRDPGDQVWNQPMAGYRILPIKARSIRRETRDGATVWAVPMKMKIYWGNDLRTPPGVISKTLKIERDTNDSDSLEESLPTGTKDETIYESRLLEFTLFFDDEVKVSDDGTRVVKAGNIVGDGIWKMQENPKQYSEYDLRNSHPDFVWMPTNSILDESGVYGNPFMDPDIVKKVSKANAENGGSRQRPPNAHDDDGDNDAPPDRESVSFKIKFDSGAFDGLREITEDAVARKLRRLFSRAGIRASVSVSAVSVHRKHVTVTVVFPDGVEKRELKSLFEDAEMPVESMERE